MNKLAIFDVSPFIHAGHTNKYSSLTKINGDAVRCYIDVIPTGGTSLIFNTIHSLYNTCDMVFCCDRNPTIKKDMIPNYKSDRDHNREIEVEKAVAEYILRECNGTVLAYSGYEADDIIYSVVQKYHEFYDNIYIYTSDSDLYFLVDDIVSICPSSSRAKSVTKQTYQMATSDGHIYNTITLSKIAFGDSTDRIPAMPKDLRVKFLEAFRTINKWEKCGDKDFVLNMTKLLVSEAVPYVLNVFPLEVENIPNTFTQLDKQMLINFGKAINNKFYRTMTEDKTFDIDAHIDKMHSMGYYIDEES